MRPSRLFILLAFTACFVLACSSSDDESGDKDGNDPSGNGDVVTPGDGGGSKDGGAIGDGAGEEVVDPGFQGCLSDDECAPLICDCHGDCVEPGERPGDLPCETDMNCGSGNFCHPCDKSCYPIVNLCQVCISENDCDPFTGVCEATGNQCGNDGQSRCLDFLTGGSFCGRVCLSDAGCPAGYSCTEVPGVVDDAGAYLKQCIPLTGNCEQDKECESTEDCEYGMFCNVGLGVCAPGCLSDQECGSDKVCSMFECQDACDDITNPCPEGQECDDEGHCKIPGGCLSKYDCIEPETFCNLETNMCEDGCETDFDCKKAALVCLNGTCVAKGCTGNWECAHGEECNDETGQCQEPEGPFCDECDSQAENQCEGDPNMCVGFQDEDGNDLGDFCLVACKPGDVDRCPQGYQCVPVKDENDQVQNEVCYRNCSVPPVGLVE